MFKESNGQQFEQHLAIICRRFTFRTLSDITKNVHSVRALLSTFLRR